MASAGKKAESGNEARWSAILRRYGYMWTDEFDLALVESVRKGYFDDEKLEREARKFDAKLAKGRAEGALDVAWKAVDYSFEDDQDAVFDGILKSLNATIEFVNPATLNATVKLFKRFGCEADANAIIAHFVATRGAEPGLFDLRAHPFGDSIDDPDIRKAFNAKDAEPKETPDFIALLEGPKENWSMEVIELLAAASVDDYHRAFKARRGEAHKRLVHNALHFSNVNGATPAMLEMSRKAEAALQEIGKESPFNAFRVARFGVKITPETEVVPHGPRPSLGNREEPEIAS